MRRVFLLLLICGGLLDARGASMVDRSFNIGTGPDWIVEHALEQPDGKILVCGLFTHFNGQSMPYIGRLNADGSVDSSFNSQVNYWVRHMLLQPDGKIVIGGMFGAVANQPRNLIARLNSDGSLDTTFNPGRGGEVSIGTGINNDPRPFIIWSELLPDGKILAVGNFHDYDGAASPGIVRINANGSRDTTFNVGAGMNTWGRFVRRLSNGQILATGWFNSYNNHSFNRMVRLNADGSYDATFNAFFGDSTSVYAAAPLPNGQFIVSGHAVDSTATFGREIERLNADGSVDSSWLGRTDEKTEGLLLQPDGKVIAVGYFRTANNVGRTALARFNPDGTLDTTVRIETGGFIWNVAQTHDQKLIVCGEFTGLDGISITNVARLILPENMSPPAAPTITQATLANGKFQCSVLSRANATYVLQYKTDADGQTWNSRPGAAGTGGPLTLEDPAPSATRFYRVQVQ
jgi:uncharacterized delta-60 repeat protein